MQIGYCGLDKESMGAGPDSASLDITDYCEGYVSWDLLMMLIQVRCPDGGLSECSTKAYGMAAADHVGVLWREQVHHWSPRCLLAALQIELRNCVTDKQQILMVSLQFPLMTHGLWHLLCTVPLPAQAWNRSDRS